MRRWGSEYAVLSLTVACCTSAAGCKLDLMRENIRFGDSGSETKACDGPEIIDASQADAMPTRITRAVGDDLDAGASAGAALCDGSDEVRLGVATGPGQVSTFSEPYGEFFVLDGHCHFYAAESGMVGVREGTLTIAQADALAIDLAVPWLASLSSSRSTCTDDPGTLIATPTNTLSCSCGDCGRDSAATQAIQHAAAWIRDLTLVGSALSGAVRALAARGELPTYDCYSSDVVAWPLSTPMLAISGLVSDGLAPSQSGVRFDDAADVVRLRQLRAAAHAALGRHIQYPEHIYVRDAEVDYALDVRDELPDGYERAVNDLLTGARNKEAAKLANAP